MRTPTEEKRRQRLLARQISLLRHLTDPRAFEEGLSDSELAGLDDGRLRLVGRMSFDKRMSKVRSALPRTFTFVPHVDGMSEGDFVSRFPPYTNLRYENAKQFVEYIRQLWKQQAMEPPFLPDLASVELAIVKANSIISDPTDGVPNAYGAPVFRMAPSVQLLHCGFDVQTFFASGTRREPPVERVVQLIIASSPKGSPRISEISTKVYNLLRASVGWRPLNLPEFQIDAESSSLIGTLAKMQIIEVAQ